MKNFYDYKNEIYKCSKCGLCQNVCPIYQELKNDCAVSRGKFIMLKGILDGDLKFNKNIEKYLDMCTKCGKCTDFCPSEIPVEDIIISAKGECHKKNDLIDIAFSIILSKLKNRKMTKKNGNIVYFKGCAGAINRNCTNATIKILDSLKFGILPIDFECCGLPYLSRGNLKEFKRVKTKNLSLIPKNYDFIITDCASCEWTLKKYDANLKFKNIYEIIAESNLKFVFKTTTTFTFHKPCHLHDITFLEKIIQKCENLKYIEMPEFDNCCGFSGEFALKNRELSEKLSLTKGLNAKSTNADYVTTTCPSCIVGLLQGKVKALNLIELLAKAEISNNTDKL